MTKTHDHTCSGSQLWRSTSGSAYGQACTKAGTVRAMDPQGIGGNSLNGCERVEVFYCERCAEKEIDGAYCWAVDANGDRIKGRFARS